MTDEAGIKIMIDQLNNFKISVQSVFIQTKRVDNKLLQIQQQAIA